MSEQSFWRVRSFALQRTTLYSPFSFLRVRDARSIFKRLVAVTCVLLLSAPLLAQQGARVPHRNLAELVADADTIVHGRVVSVVVEPHPQYAGLQTVVVNLEVMELLKGQSAAPFSFRQYVWDQRDARSRLGYKGGEEVLLLLSRPHEQTGLSSPVGLEQGRFRITLDSDGNRRATNGFNNGALFSGMDTAKDRRLQSLGSEERAAITQHRSGPLPYRQLRAVVRALAVE